MEHTYFYVSDVSPQPQKKIQTEMEDQSISEQLDIFIHQMSIPYSNGKWKWPTVL